MVFWRLQEVKKCESRLKWVNTFASSSIIDVWLCPKHDSGNCAASLLKNWSFSLAIYSVNVTKPARNCGFGHIYRRIPHWDTPIFEQLWIPCFFVYFIDYFLIKLIKLLLLDFLSKIVMYSPLKVWRVFYDFIVNVGDILWFVYDIFTKSLV